MKSIDDDGDVVEDDDGDQDVGSKSKAERERRSGQKEKGWRPPKTGLR